MEEAQKGMGLTTFNYNHKKTITLLTDSTLAESDLSLRSTSFSPGKIVPNAISSLIRSTFSKVKIYIPSRSAEIGV